jgi:hypothetical protein
MSTGVAPWLVRWFSRGLFLGFYQIDIQGNDLARQYLANSVNTCIALALWLTGFVLVGRTSEG